MKHTHETQAASIGKPVNDRNAEYAIGWELYCNGLDESECVNEYQRQGWDEAKFNKAPVTAPDEQERADAQFAAEYEAALAVGRRYEATGDVGVFFHATYR